MSIGFPDLLAAVVVALVVLKRNLHYQAHD